MNFLDGWRAWRRGRELNRLRKKYAEPPEGLEAGRWIVTSQGAEDARRGDDQLASNLKKISAAYKSAQQQRSARSRSPGSGGL